MGRRSLPKINPALDLSRHLLTLEQLPQAFEDMLAGKNAKAVLRIA